MNALIPTFAGELAGEQQTLVNARDLHATLSVGKDFSTWIKDRLETYGFINGVEFSPVLGKTSIFGGRPKTEYILSLDMAKELCLVENTEQGRKARRYFIDMEKVARLEVPAYLRQPTLSHHELESINRLKQVTLAAKPTWGKIARYRALGLTQVEISLLLKLKDRTVRQYLREMAACGIGDYRADPLRVAAGRKGLQVVKQRQLHAGMV